jgi:hypothetical protein
VGISLEGVRDGARRPVAIAVYPRLLEFDGRAACSAFDSVRVRVSETG